jgi:hypothetical protein
VHGYRSVRLLREVIVDGPYLSTAYVATRPAVMRLGRWPATHFTFEFETHIHGLGYSLVDVHVRGFGIRGRMWVLPAPIDAQRISLHLAASCDSSDADVHPWLRRLPRRLRAAAFGRILLLGLVTDARRDFAIWQHKRYVHPPALAEGDGPIGKYRSWAAQFYA